MEKQRIILVNDSRLMRGLLKKVIGKKADLEIVHEVDDIADFPEVARRREAEWAILMIHPEEDVPDYIEEIIKEKPEMRFLLMGKDGSHVRMKWNEPHEVDLDGKNLTDILNLMGQKQHQNENKERMVA